MMSWLADRRGSLMLLVLMVMFSLSVFVSIFLYSVKVSNRVVSSQVSNNQAFYLAEAGLNKAIWYLLNDGTWHTTDFPAAAGSGVNDPKSEPLGSGSYTLWVKSLGGGNFTIVSSGTCDSMARIVHQSVSLISDEVTVVAESWGECSPSAAVCP